MRYQRSNHAQLETIGTAPTQSYIGYAANEPQSLFYSSSHTNAFSIAVRTV